MKNCLFCAIAQHKISAKIQYEDERLVAFDDINPQAPVHILIIPKKHLENISDATPQDKALLGEMMLLAKKLARQKKIDKTGFRLVINNKKHAGQIVDHLHMHLIGGEPLGSIA